MVRSRIVPLAAALALLAAVAATANAEPSAGPACRTQEVRAHNEVVFGHFATTAGARKRLKAVAAFSFKGLKIEDDGCGDFEVEIDGADTQAVRSSVSDEAGKAGFQVTFEQTGEALEPPPGQVYGVFASFATIPPANALMLRLGHTGFRYIDLARRGNRWLVVMPQVPIKAALSIAKEVSQAGFHIAFEPAK